MILPPRAAQPGHAFGGVHSMSVAPQRRNRHERRRSGEITSGPNIGAVKALGGAPVMGVGGGGSLRAETPPGELALPSQSLDSPRGTRAGSFCGGGRVAHIPGAQPACRATAALLARVA